MLNDIQKKALDEIEVQIRIIRNNDTPDPPSIPVIPVEGDLQTAIDQASDDGVILDLIGREHFTSGLRVYKPIEIRNGAITANPNTNDIINVTGDHVNLTSLLIRGADTNNTKRGIAANGTNMNFFGLEIRNIRRAGQETQAIGMWNSVGPLSVKASILEAGSIGFLAGGTQATIPNTIPTDLFFDSCLFTRPIEWRGQGFNCKNAFELKCARNVIVQNSVLENVWTEGQSGSIIVLTPTQYGNSPENIVENVVFAQNTVRNCGNGINLLGFTQSSNPTQRSRNIRFHNNKFNISRTNFTGAGGLLQVGKEPHNVEFLDNEVIQDGNAFIRVTDRVQIMGFNFRANSVNPVGQYEIHTPFGSHGLEFAQSFPDGQIIENTFYGACSTFKKTFPNNNYL